MGRATVMWTSMAAFVAAFVGSTAALGTPPDSSDDGPAVVRWFIAHDDNVRLAVWFTAIAVVAFMIFAVLMRARLPEVHRDLFLVGAVLLAGETSVQTWILAAIARHPASLDPSTARTLLDISTYWGPVLTTATVLMLIPITVVALSGNGLPRWVGYVGAVALVEQVVETITIFGKSGFIAPGGPMNTVLGAGLTIIALLSAGVAVARTS